MAGTTREELQGFVKASAKPGAAVHTDTASAYASLEGFEHEAVNHAAGEYVRGTAHTNGIESFWALFKRGLSGTYHHLSVRHLARYLAEFAGRPNVRCCDTADLMKRLAAGLNGRRLTWKMLAGQASPAAAA